MVVGAGLRVALLSLLTLQNMGQTLLIKLAQQQGSHPDSLVVMLFAELVKAAVSLAFFIVAGNDAAGRPADQGSWRQHFSPAAMRRSMKLVPIALMFAVQNQLLFEAIHNLDPPVHQALSQLKILWAGVFSLVLLGRRLSQVQWIALLLLACGAALVQIESSLCPSKAAAAAASGANPARGFAAVFVACIISGLAGCYTELMLKTEKMPMWLQSAQVALASAFVLVSMMVCQRTWSGMSTLQHDLWNDLLRGFIPMTWVVVAMISLGGLTVVAVLRYADNVLKGMAVVFSLLLSGVASSFLFETSTGPVFWISAIIICCSVFLFQQGPPPSQSSPAEVEERKQQERKELYLSNGRPMPAV